MPLPYHARKTSLPPRVLIAGCGYLGLAVARQLLEEGVRVTAVTRTEARAERLRKLGLQVVVGDLAGPDPIALPTADGLVFALGFDRSGGERAESVWERAWQRLWRSWPAPEIPRVVAISTTGVYGETPMAKQRGGGEFWIDETSPCAPRRPGAVAHWKMEQRVVDGPWSGRTSILRLGGIYGPERLPRARDLVAGRPLAVDPEHWLNLIHVDDGARVVCAALSEEAWGRFTVVTDGHPVRRADFYRAVSARLGAPDPIFETTSLDFSELQRGGQRRIRSERFSTHILPLLRFPTYREGLAEIFGECC